MLVRLRYESMAWVCYLIRQLLGDGALARIVPAVELHTFSQGTNGPWREAHVLAGEWSVDDNQSSLCAQV